MTLDSVLPLEFEAATFSAALTCVATSWNGGEGVAGLHFP